MYSCLEAGADDDDDVAVDIKSSSCTRGPPYSYHALSTVAVLIFLEVVVIQFFVSCINHGSSTVAPVYHQHHPVVEYYIVHDHERRDGRSRWLLTKTHRCFLCPPRCFFVVIGWMSISTSTGGS
mmetsp:Transcript_34327/g.38434  ORF Transcript_34327/g.38434 Transcript_34327/m.38434 type:complete len:124 (+) Transcript_34327:64-435(+)